MNFTPSREGKKYFVKTFGCQMNEHDSEKIAGMFELDGMTKASIEDSADIMFGQGISREGSLLDVGVDHGIVRKAGAWFTYDEIQLGQGKENSKRFLRENADIALQLETDVYNAVGMIESDEATEEDTVEESEDATPEK